MNKQEILNESARQRAESVMAYQINIDNYTLAVARIDELNDPELKDFRGQLIGLLATEKLEQKKEQVLLDVIRQQLK